MRPQRSHALVTPTFDTIAEWLRNHGRVLAGNLEFGVSNTDQSKNIKNWRATGTTPGVANTDFTITHGLGYIPDTILMQDTDNGGVLYRSPNVAAPWTKTTVTLRCTTVSANYKIRVV